MFIACSNTVFLSLFSACTPQDLAKSFCTPRPIEQTSTKLPVNIQSNNEIKHNVACYRCIFINHNIVHDKTNSVDWFDKTKVQCIDKTNSVQNQFCRNKQEAIYYVTVTLSYDKKSFRNADVKKGFGKCFLISNIVENKFLANSL